MGGRGANSTSAKSFFTAKERKAFANGKLPNVLPGTRYPNELRKALDEIADNYRRPKALDEYAHGTFASGRARMQVADRGGSLYIQFGNRTMIARYPQDAALTQRQKDALADIYAYNAWKNMSADEKRG